MYEFDKTMEDTFGLLPRFVVLTPRKKTAVSSEYPSWHLFSKHLAYTFPHVFLLIYGEIHSFAAPSVPFQNADSLTQTS